MMKKSVFYVFTVFILFAVSGNVLGKRDGESGGWLWQKHEVDCTASITITFNVAGQKVGYEQNWEGVKKVCRDGSRLCWGSDCA